jgi:MFS family permease
VSAGTSAWGPLRHPLFRRLWAAQLASNVGTWMQVVGAFWLMGTLSGSPALVALVQTATTLPVVLLGLPAGALADIVDRRRLLLATQAWMLICSTALGVTTALDLVTPELLLGLTFALGVGVALNGPAWQAIQPELVPAEDFAQAVTLGGMSINLGRAVGPAIGGALVALAGPQATFFVNSASFLAVLAAVAAWRRPAHVPTVPPERVLGAIRAGLRYTRNAPALTAVLARTVLFVFPATAVFTLLPVVARSELDLGAGAFGLLLGAFGAGAVLSAALLPRLRQREPLDVIVAGATLMLALVTVYLGFARLPVVVAAALVAGGLAWLLAISSLNVAAQYSLPAWVRARGLAVYLLVFSGSAAAGSAVWGLVAQVADVTVALLAAGALLAVGVAGTLRFRLGISERLDLRPSLHWPEPNVLVEGQAQGPVLVTVEYRVPAAAAAEFGETMRSVARMRRRTGAVRWGVFQDATDPECFFETFLVESWDEHRRQHERTTQSDRRLEERRNALLAPGTIPVVRHYQSPSQPSAGSAASATSPTKS